MTKWGGGAKSCSHAEGGGGGRFGSFYEEPGTVEMVCDLSQIDQSCQC